MNPKRKAVAVAVAGTALGAAGLGILAIPAGAGEAPDLPPIGAQALIESALNADAPAMAGEVEFTNNAGLPVIPGMDVLDAEQARVFHDGTGKARIALEHDNSEQTIVHDGKTLWFYDAGERTATKAAVPGDRDLSAKAPDPAALTTDLLKEMRKHSDVTVDGTARVAGRPAYELVLTPKPDERTLVREVRVAIDSENRLPLRASLLTNGTTEPALEIGFSEIEFTPQPANLFTFTPPEGTKVTEERGDARNAPKNRHDAEKMAGQVGKVVGDGWDTVFVTRMPSDLAGMADKRPEGAEGMDPSELLDQVGTRVTGSFGSGHVITTKVGSALITDDGRVAVGAVPQQVLTKALETK